MATLRSLDSKHGLTIVLFCIVLTIALCYAMLRYVTIVFVFDKKTVPFTQ